jgi:hypothetical protein
LPRAAGLSRRAFAEQVRVSFAKVAEFQRRGLVHLHAVIRLDGPDGPATLPPAWATVELLASAVLAAASRSHVETPSSDLGTRELRWGEQIDVHPLRVVGDERALTDEAVAGYVAKYATKAAECTGTLDRPVRQLRQVHEADIPEHAREMILTAWRLGSLAEFAPLRLRAWAHQLGYGGHFSTKSRQYSTTLGELREVRARYRRSQHRGRNELPETVVTVGEWEYAGSGYGPGEKMLAAGIRRDVALNREVAREELAWLASQEADGWSPGWEAE